jgi:transposase
VKKYSKLSEANPDDDHAAENRRLKRELTRVTEERDILKKATVYFANEAK